MTIADFDRRLIKLFFPETASVSSFLLMSDKNDEPAPHKTLQKFLSFKQGPDSIKTFKSIQTVHDGLMQWTYADPEKRVGIAKPDLKAIWNKDFEGLYTSVWKTVLAAMHEMNWNELLPMTMKTIVSLDRQRNSLDKAVKIGNRNGITKSLQLGYCGSVPPQVKSIGNWLKTQKNHSDFSQIAAYLGIIPLINILSALDADLLALENPSTSSNRTTLFEEIFTSKEPIQAWVQHLQHRCLVGGAALPKHWLIRAITNDLKEENGLSDRERQKKHRLKNGQTLHPSDMVLILNNLEEAGYVNRGDIFELRLLYFMAVFASNVLKINSILRERAPDTFRSVLGEEDLSPLSDYSFMINRARESRARMIKDDS